MDMQIFIGFTLTSLMLVMMAVHQVWQFDVQFRSRPSLVRFWLLALVNFIRVLMLQEPLSFKVAYPSLVNCN
ncbi:MULTISPECIES: hypothetical protein [unclassified Motilimonas]|uniref:hypothetical protein n=1 Tax=Motilimonas TaxID=1914248 RepID=UPI001E6217DB|nr:MULTISPECIES: hypothetical protein [unclassified Motilimonas]MCE0558816.1 hypothetical protein [Motilimonas sp. E26]MDO6526527.1 hypothetical protein [Motilimonas sp. 1_MG-2023]